MDLLPLVEQSSVVGAYCITDAGDVAGMKDRGWEILSFPYPREDMDSRMRAKFFKVFPWEIPQVSKADISIYIDGSIRVLSSDLALRCSSLVGDMSLFRHPTRGNIYDELVVSKRMDKYNSQRISEQVESYRSIVPKKIDSGLYMGGFLVRRHTDRVRKLMSDWWHEMIKWSCQDQLSLPKVCLENGFVPEILPEETGNLFEIV